MIAGVRELCAVCYDIAGTNVEKVCGGPHLSHERQPDILESRSPADLAFKTWGAEMIYGAFLTQAGEGSEGHLDAAQLFKIPF